MGAALVHLGGVRFPATGSFRYEAEFANAPAAFRESVRRLPLGRVVEL